MPDPKALPLVAHGTPSKLAVWTDQSGTPYLVQQQADSSTTFTPLETALAQAQRSTITERVTTDRDPLRTVLPGLAVVLGLVLGGYLLGFFAGASGQRMVIVPHSPVCDTHRSSFLFWFSGNQGVQLMSAPKAKGYNSSPKGIQSHILPHAGALTERATRYFGIDLARLPQMGDNELALFADRANAMTRLKEILPILEKHFTTLIEGQVEYEQFVQRVLKQVEKGSKQIDKSLLDAWLLSKGYDKHLQLLNQKAGHGIQKLEAEYRSEYDLNRLDFQSAIKLIHLRHQNRAKAMGEKVPQAQRQLQVQEALRRQAETRKELLTYGTAGKPGKGFWHGVKDFFRV